MSSCNEANTELLVVLVEPYGGAGVDSNTIVDYTSAGI